MQGGGMSSRQLPDRQNLDNSKKHTKSLLQAAQTGDADARRRFRVLPAFSATSEIPPGALALHDAQSVIAREYGFASWNALRDEVEARTLSFDAAVVEFIRAATGGASGRAQRLLALYPRIATANLYTCIVVGDAHGVDALLREVPEIAKQSGGPQNWEPLLYACHTCM